MRRGYTSAQYLERVRALRAGGPRISRLTTDLIAGFPGETEEEFQRTLDLAREAAFDAAYTFVFSPRDGTAAADLAGQVPDDVKRERVREADRARAGARPGLACPVGSVAAPRSSWRAPVATGC